MRIAAELKYIQCIYLFKSLHIQYKMHSRDGHFVQIDFSLPLFPFSKSANVDTIFEQNSLPGGKTPLNLTRNILVFGDSKKAKAWKHLSSLTLPETNSSHLKMDGWNRLDFFRFLFGGLCYFQGMYPPGN